MNETLIRGDVICFEPDSGWQFDGFDGQVTLDPPDRSFLIDEKPVAIDDDLLNLASELVNVGYKATGFDKVAGAVMTAKIRIDEATLSQVLVCDGKSVGRRETTGTFEVVCRPSLSGSTPPVPDPSAARRTGTWYVREAGQQTFQAE